MRRAAACALALVLALVAGPRVAGANGGTVQVSSQLAGPYDVSVYTSPSPITVGTVDVSVLVQRPGGETVQDATVGVSAKPPGAAGEGPSYAATHDLATNRLFYAANVPVDAPGSWQFVVRVEGAEGVGEVTFSADVSEASALDNPLVIAAVVAAPLVALAVWYLARTRGGSRGK